MEAKTQIRGICQCCGREQAVVGGRVFWKTDKGRQGWTGIQAWRKFNNVEAEVV